MENININLNGLSDFIPLSKVSDMKYDVQEKIEALTSGKGKGNDFLGWLKLPEEMNDAVLKDIQESAQKLALSSEFVVVVGIGGSYLGSKAVIEALSHSFAAYRNNSAPIVLFAGQNISSDYMAELLEILDNRKFSIIVISKSGTTTEPGLAFRLLKQKLESAVPQDEIKNRIIAITDAKKGALRVLAEKEGYKTFPIADNVGGRYSVLSPVGLLPIAVAGFDIKKLIEGAAFMEELTTNHHKFDENPAALYAAAREMLYSRGKKVELLVSYHPKLVYFAEWWKQLYGESEGKQNKGLFPASVNFTADLHSMGQYIQEGERILFETVISIGKPNKNVEIPNDNDNLDQLNFLSGKQVDEVNKMAELGTRIAHIDGRVPVLTINVPELNEFYLGQMIYFFEVACAISGYLLDVNPFDQPGVEAYKNNMFALLGKPGFEEAGKKLKARLGK
ncbi:MAG: glucose-6-phosphate isomerase [Bacteroidales bacterium]|nr:glucose-6-phosphate isomerase [Bacteroidales bacterium]